MPRLTRLIPLFALTVLSAAACSRKRPPATSPTPAAGVADDGRDSLEAGEARRRAEEERRRAEEAERLRAAARNTLTATIYFEFDRSDLTADARALLDARIPVLRSNPDVRIRISGHTDERGSDEYNLALGQRRAAAAKRYLTQRGVEAGRIEVASFGEEQPLCSDNGESCWSQNRRDEFTIVVGEIARR